jgi:phage gp46-like protein
MRLDYDPDRGSFDLGLAPTGGVDAGDGNSGALQAAVWVSLFTDALADAADMTPDLGADRRGWWADSGRAPTDRMGSLIWLHLRDKRTETTRLAIESTARESLQWLLDDGVTAAVDVAAVWMDAPRDALQLTVDLTEPNGVRRDWKVDLLWGGIAR